MFALGGKTVGDDSQNSLFPAPAGLTLDDIQALLGGAQALMILPHHAIPDNNGAADSSDAGKQMCSTRRSICQHCMHAQHCIYCFFAHYTVM
jgi:hypothetical protein